MSKPFLFLIAPELDLAEGSKKGDRIVRPDEIGGVGSVK